MRIIYFDGVCGLCNGFVDLVLKIDRKHEFKFSALQSDFARTQLPEALTRELKTIVYQKDAQIYVRSDAVLEVLRDLGGFWSIAAAAAILPRNLRDGAYDLVAENRYRLFGKKDSCRLPTPEERSRFIS